jgi:hypothetical protein
MEDSRPSLGHLSTFKIQALGPIFSLLQFFIMSAPLPKYVWTSYYRDSGLHPVCLHLL